MTPVRLRTNIEWLPADLSDTLRLFMGDVPISADSGDILVTHTHSEAPDGKWREACEWIGADGRAYTSEHTADAKRGGLEEKRVIKRAAKTALYKLLSKIFERTPPWGSLTGIRPTRLMYEALERGLTPFEAKEWLEREFFVSRSKAELLYEILDMQRGLVDVPENEFDLYIGIPFCRTRCAYCSFSSGVTGDGRLTWPYVDALTREIELTANIMRDKGLKLRAGYVGGGTPTALTPDQLDRVLCAAMSGFPGGVEWTVEAGRPDTIDKDKLSVLKRRGVTRISVNPQTFSDSTLEAIGRAHTANDTVNAYKLARDMGFDNINMDLIAALPGEALEDFMLSLDAAIALEPESVTVHSLAIKRSSKLHETLTVMRTAHNQADAQGAEAMIDGARRALTESGWRPYYLYRQKYMAGNLENVGYAKPGRACLYNIGNMEETAKVLALGAGAITKWLFPRTRRIERAANLKNIEEYIARVDEMVERKLSIIGEGAQA